MNILTNIEQYDNTYIYFGDSIKNNIINEGHFIKIIYSTNYFSLNGVYLLVKFTNIVCEKYYNKYKCMFNVVDHKNIIDKIKLIEEQILDKLKLQNKTPQYTIYDQLKHGYIKMHNEYNSPNMNFVLKISGIWESNTHYGVTFKFINL